ncbi:MAG: hypothetical protein Q8R15_05235, partial [Candidatus Micrarchaeota archaeon]|nr:hypothetical protein [Candidatus Micrarchaeota archaeon]
YSGSCAYRFCQPGLLPKLNACPVSQTCPDGSQAAYAFHDGKCPVYQCKEKLSASCPLPACPPGEHAQPSYGSGATAQCPIYTCKSISPVTPTSTNEYCPSSSPTTCTSDQTYWSEPYSYTTPTGKSLTCYKSSCVSPASLPTCTSSCSTYGGAYSGYQVSTCSANQRLKTSYMTYTENSKACKCEGSKWCETDYTTLPVCAGGSGCQAPTCTAGQVLKTSPQPYSSTVNGVQCACTSKWCETDYSTLPVCANGPGCQAPTCGTGETLQSSPSPYSSNVNGVQCACTTKWCSSSTTNPSTPTPGSNTSAGACPYIAPVQCTGTQVSTSSLIPGYQNCWQTRCVDATSLPACTTSCPISSYTPACTSGQILGTNYYTMQENSQSCRCQSQTCTTDPALCGTTAICPSSGQTSCGTGQIQRTSTTPYYGNGCTTPVQCTSSWCETDQSQCGSQSCPTYSPWTPTTCETGYTQQTTTSSYYPPGCSSTSIQCTQYSCVPTATTSASRPTGLQVGVGRVGQTSATTVPAANPPSTAYPPAVIVDSREDLGGGSSGNSMCTSSGEVDRSGFMRQCLSFSRGNNFATHTDEGIDETCSREVAFNKAELEKFCAEGKDPYLECKGQVSDSKAKLDDAYGQCKALANREQVIELIEKKAAAECNKLELASEEVRSIDELFDQTNLPLIEQTRAELATDSIVLTKAELEKLKADIAKDVFSQVMSQLSTVFGLNAAQQSAQAEFKLRQVDNLFESAKAMREVCLKLESSSDRDKCEAFATSIEQDAEALRTEAHAQNIAAGGIVETLKALIGFTSQPTSAPTNIAVN